VGSNAPFRDAGRLAGRLPIERAVGRHTAVLILENRSSADGRFWLGLELVAFSISGMALVTRYHFGSLLLVGAIGTGLFGLGHTLRRGQGDRTGVWRSADEAIRVATLVLSGPAAYVVAQGRFGPGAWILFVASWLLFWGGVDLAPGGLDATTAHQALGRARRSGNVRGPVGENS